MSKGIKINYLVYIRGGDKTTIHFKSERALGVKLNKCMCMKPKGWFESFHPCINCYNQIITHNNSKFSNLENI